MSGDFFRRFALRIKGGEQTYLVEGKPFDDSKIKLPCSVKIRWPHGDVEEVQLSRQPRSRKVGQKKVFTNLLVAEVYLGKGKHRRSYYVSLDCFSGVDL